MKKIILLASLALSINAFAQVPSYVPTNGLASWYPFTGNANDLSGNNNNGTVNGATLTTDRFGNTNSAYTFDGLNDFIDVLHSSSLSFATYQQTISFWMKVPSIPHPSFLEAVMSKYSNSGNPLQGFIIHFAGNSSLFYSIKNGSGFNWGDCPLDSTNFYPSNSYYHIVYTNDNDSLRCYVNGIKIISTDIPTGTFIGTNTSSLVFGKESNMGGGVDFFKGELDDIGIWNRALSVCEISDLYNSQLGSLNTTATQTVTALDTYTWPINSQTYTQSGTYTAVIPNSAGCDSTITLDLSLDFTGLEENSEGALFSVFPNPAQSTINVKLDIKLIGKVYSIYDNTGRVVLTGKVNSENTTIELGNLLGGIYMFSVGENMKQSFKVIKE
jgi:hypothetical protein